MTTSSNINLLTQRRQVTKRLRRQNQKVVSMSVLALAIYLAIMVPIVGYRLFLSQRLKSIASDKAETLQTLTSLKSVEERYLLLENKLSLSDQVLAERPDSKETLTTVIGLIPEGVVVTSLDFGADNVLTMSGDANEVFAFGELIRSLEGSVEQGLYPKVVLESLNRDDEGLYRFSVELHSESEIIPTNAGSGV